MLLLVSMFNRPLAGARLHAMCPPVLQVEKNPAEAEQAASAGFTCQITGTGSQVPARL